MLFFKKAIVEEVMPPIPPTVYAVSLNFIRDVAFSICSYVPPSVVDAAMDTKVAVAGLLEGLGSSIPRSIEVAKVAAHQYSRDVASSIGSNVPDDLKSILGANDVAGSTIFLAMLLSTLLMLAVLRFVFAVPSSTTYDSRHITKEDSDNKVSDEGSSTAPFSGGSSSGSIGSSLDGDISTPRDEDDVDKVELDSSSLDGDASTPRDEDDVPLNDDDEDDEEETYVVSVASYAPSVISSSPFHDVDAAKLDNAQRAGPSTQHARTIPSVGPYDGGDDDDLSDLSVSPSFEMLIKIEQDDDGDGISPPKTPDCDRRAASAVASVVSGISDDGDVSSGGASTSGPPSSTPTRSGGSKMTQNLRRGLSSVSLKSLGTPLRISSRKVVPN